MTYDEIQALREVVATSLNADTAAIIATLVGRDGHSYRELGDLMVMTELLQLVGGVSGGCLEGYIGRTGRRVLTESGRDSVVMRFDTAVEEPGKPVLGCGGRLDILVEFARPDHIAYLDAILDAMRQPGEAVSLIRFDDQGAWPDAPSCRTLLRDGQPIWGEISAEEDTSLVDQAIELRQNLIHEGPGHRVTACYHWPQPRLAIFGGQDDALPLARIAKLASWHVTLADRRGRLATAPRFPEVDQLIDRSWDDALDAIDLPARTAVVVMTHSFDDDLELLPPLIDLAPMYLGLLGPSSRTQRLWDTLGESAKTVVRSPVGLRLGEKSPPAIAVGIMAELIAAYRGAEAAFPTASGIRETSS